MHNWFHSLEALEKTIVFPIPNVAPENPTTFMDLPPTYTQTLSLGGYDSLTCIRSQTRQCPLLAELPQRLLPNSEKVYGSTDSL